MRSKKILSVFIAFIVLVLTCCSPIISFASSFFVVDGDVSSCPGNTRVYTEKDKYNYAWLDSVIIRDGSAAVTQLTLYPVCDYPYSHTYQEFIDDCNSYMKLFDIADTAVERSVMDILKKIYYTLVASGEINDPIPDMRAYNESMGIVYPNFDEKFTDIYTVIVYACLKNDIGKILSTDGVTITRGTGVEGAVVKIIASICGIPISADIDTISEFSYLFTREYVIEESKYPVSDDPRDDEVTYWAKLQAAEKAGYSVPSNIPYNELSVQDKEYVDYAYDASIFTARYGVKVDPYRLQVALESTNPTNEVSRLILISMLDHVNATYSEGESSKELFNKTLKEGFFALDNEFYTDIYNYKLYVPADCQKVWVTAFPIADQLDDGSLSKVTTFVNGKVVANKSTNSVEIKGDALTFSVKTEYNGKNDSAAYTFTVIKTADSSAYNKVQIDLSDSIEEIVGNISDVITAPAINVNDGVTPSGNDRYDNTLTTYALDESSYSYTGSLFEIYPTNERGEVITTSDPLSVTHEDETSASVLSDVAQTVKENPAVVAAPVGLIAVGASFGFIFYSKRKNEFEVGNDDNE